MLARGRDSRPFDVAELGGFRWLGLQEVSARGEKGKTCSGLRLAPMEARLHCGAGAACWCAVLRESGGSLDAHPGLHWEVASLVESKGTPAKVLLGADVQQGLVYWVWWSRRCTETRLLALCDGFPQGFSVGVGLVSGAQWKLGSSVLTVYCTCRVTIDAVIVLVRQLKNPGRGEPVLDLLVTDNEKRNEM